MAKIPDEYRNDAADMKTPAGGDGRAGCLTDVIFAIVFALVLTILFRICS